MRNKHEAKAFVEYNVTFQFTLRPQEYVGYDETLECARMLAHAILVQEADPPKIDDVTITVTPV